MFIFERPFSWWQKQNFFLYKTSEFKDDSILGFYEQNNIFSENSSLRSDYCEFLSINNLLDILRDFCVRCTDRISNKSDYWNSIYLNTILQMGKFAELNELYDNLEEHLRLDYRRRVNKTYLNGRSDVNFTNENMLFASLSSNFPVNVVNLPTDFYRRNRLAGLFSLNNIDVTFSRAYSPADAVAEDRSMFRFDLPDDLNVMDGTYGNQFTVYKIMKKITQSNCDGWNLVVEDDVLMVANAGEDLLSMIPSDAELYFVNDRLCKFNKIYSIEDHLRLWQDDPKIDSTAPGSDAYMVKRSAAEKIVNYFESYGIFNVGTDWAIISCCLNNESAIRLGEDRIIYKNYNNFFKENDNTNRVIAYVNSYPIFIHSPFNSYRAWR